ncbi:unnamed protein product [Parascedosporium putredinis]|uniref:Tricarboxylate transport protein n=1 Tax=Parascedosporium putredinis TaxID=1442378 RepID=A0A9P1GXG8_9PEZI|nr:unnamed protein product [Parascedosporium putredinis]CAI7988985.1 unnamed protein product [Parascedosporium putredinis]
MAQKQEQDQPVVLKGPSVLRSILAGSLAGAVEIVAKTRSQLNRRLADGKKLPWPPFGSQWYAGCTTLVIGNSLKAGIRFVAFDQYKSLLADENGKLSGPRTVIAGLGAGVTESLLAVTPFESIKTTLIDDRKSAKPRMKGFLSAVPIIAHRRVLHRAWGKLGTAGTFAVGGLAGLITVYVTQPLDTIKTRMQSIEAKSQYGNSFRCAALILKHEGVLTFWSGALPRLARLVLSGGIVFTMYEKTIDLMQQVDPDQKYI